jgi:hypothetical protein
MVELEGFSEEFMSILRKSVREFISTVDNDYTGELPTRTIYSVKGRTVSEKDITWPGIILQQYQDESAKAFQEIAEWIEANPDKSYRWEGVFDPARSEEQPVTSDWIHDPNREQLIESFKTDLLELTTEIVNYTGGIEYNEEAFTSATETFMIEMNSMMDSRSKSREYRVIFPLLNFTLEGQRIELDESLYLVDRLDGEWISHIELSELTAEELASVYTSERSRQFRGVQKAFNKSSHGIKIHMHGSPHASNDYQVRAAVIAALRLFKHRQPEVHGGPGYRMTSGALYHRENIFDISGSIGPMSTRGGARFREKYKIEVNEREDFSEFWKTYKDKLNIESDKNVSKSLRRLNEMYRKTNVEDRIVDCASALEGTLLQDINPGSSLTFRMMLRSGILLDNRIRFDRPTIREIFRAIYIARGEIVHSNRRLEEIIDNNDRFAMFNGNKPAPRQFVLIARDVLTKILLVYIVEEVDMSKSIAEVNQEVDEAALNAQYL